MRVTVQAVAAAGLIDNTKRVISGGQLYNDSRKRALADACGEDAVALALPVKERLGGS